MSSLETRFPPPVVLLACMALIVIVDQIVPELGASGGDPLKSALASLLGAGGLVLAIVAAVQFRLKRTTINPMRPDTVSSLVTDGVYAFSRNPIYVGDAMILAAFGVYWLHLAAIPALALFVFWLDRFQIQPEERAIRQKFGAEYDAYCARVRRWL